MQKSGTIPRLRQRYRPSEYFLSGYQIVCLMAVRIVEKKGREYSRAFAKQMWQKCGARVVVMMAWKDCNGEAMATM